MPPCGGPHNDNQHFFPLLLRCGEFRLTTRRVGSRLLLSAFERSDPRISAHFPSFVASHDMSMRKSLPALHSRCSPTASNPAFHSLHTPQAPVPSHSLAATPAHSHAARSAPRSASGRHARFSVGDRALWRALGRASGLHGEASEYEYVSVICAGERTGGRRVRRGVTVAGETVCALGGVVCSCRAALGGGRKLGEKGCEVRGGMVCGIMCAADRTPGPDMGRVCFFSWCGMHSGPSLWGRRPVWGGVGCVVDVAARRR